MSIDKKMVNKSFGRGGPRCACCNPKRAHRVRKSTKQMIRKQVRTARKRAKHVAIASQTERRGEP